MKILDQALVLAAIGWPVFPIRPRKKKPATEHGFKDASTDPAIIQLWFGDYPERNLGLRTGEDAKLFVLDVDPRHGGDNTLATLVARYCPLPKTVCCRTGSGGRHYYFRYPATRVRNRAGFLPGLDIRGQGGYVVLPPSIHPDGGPYAWVDGHSPHDVEIADAPAWLLALVAGKSGAKTYPKARKSSRDHLLRRADAYVAVVPGVEEGQRNDAAFRLAGQLRALEGRSGERLGDAEVLERVQRWNNRCTPRLDDDELEQCVRNSATNGTPLDSKPPPVRSGSGRAPEPALDGRVTLVMRAGEMHVTADECLRILSCEHPPRVFQWCRSLVLVTYLCEGQAPSDSRFSARIHPITESGLCDIMNQRIQFLVQKVNQRTGEIESVPINCPLTLARWILARGQWPGIARLTGIIEVPSMLADGRILDVPGHDAKSGLFVDIAKGEFSPAPEFPTREDAMHALRTVINPLFAEFPFETPASRSVLLSSHLAAVSRPAFPTLPMSAFTAPSMASGKTLLADSVSVTACGHTASSISQGESEEESEKRIHSALLAGQRVLLIDNVTRPLGGDSLSSAITSTSVGVRRFRTQEIAKVPTWNTLWLATGNNLELDKDMCSRALFCRLDPRTEHPEQREFRIPHLLDHMREHRAEIVLALLTILRAFVVAGRPKANVRPLNRFGGWSDLVRSALIWLGEADPVLTMNPIGQADPETQGLVMLLHALRGVFESKEFTAAQTISSAFMGAPLREALDVVCPARVGSGHDGRRLGRFLQRSRGRVVDGLLLELTTCPSGTNRYRVLDVQENAEHRSRGSRGSDPTDAHARAHPSAYTHAPAEGGNDSSPAYRQNTPTSPTTPVDGGATTPAVGPETALGVRCDISDWPFSGVPDKAAGELTTDTLPGFDNEELPGVHDA
jgi:hypothetical protein